MYKCSNCGAIHSCDCHKRLAKDGKTICCNLCVDTFNANLTSQNTTTSNIPNSTTKVVIGIVQDNPQIAN